ncbi:mercury(II) reductase [Ancylomarina longa]|uniref:Mercuric reductase n=2 Tax=Ancylomarina longa TaxID=2487017 RepID=A0A434AFN2_9BACT|nr:mercury(II) reductase [Ancylomarina longa]
MTCDHCAQTITKKFEGKDGIVSNNVSHQSGNGIFEFDPGKISKEEIAEIINSTGHYKVVGEIPKNNIGSKPFDLIIIGGGSAAFSAAIKAESLGLSTLMVNEGLNFGGTCVNVGCVPSKNLIRAGEAAHHARHSNFTGIKPKGVDIDFTQIIKDKKKLVATLQEKKYIDVVSDFQNLKMVTGWAEFVDDKTIIVGGKEKYTALKFLIATGSTTQIPNIKGLSDIDYLTNVSLFDLEKQAESMIVLGGGYIALEIAQAYQRLGTKVTLLQRSAHVLSSQSEDIAEELTSHLRKEGLTIHTGLRFIEIKKDINKISVLAEQNGEEKLFEAEKILIATGIKPNTQRLKLENIGLQLTPKGEVQVNEKMETNLSHIFAAGDVTNTPPFVYTAANEGNIAIANAFEGEEKKVDYSSLPWVVFTDPQIAGAGLDEAQAEAQNIPFDVSKLELKNIPRAIAANDTRGFIKLIRNTKSDKLIGARVVAPEGGELIQQLSMAIKYGITIKDLAECLYPYLTLGEGIKLTAITFGKDVSKLSCCAV